jgi:hypothetical protein
MTEPATSRAWRSPAIIRDRKTVRPEIGEAIVPIDRQIAIPLLIAKAHGELHEIATGPTDASEYGDVLTVLDGLARIVSPRWTGDTNFGDDAFAAILEDAATMGWIEDERPGYTRPGRIGEMHGLLEALARDLTDWRTFSRIVCLLLAEAADHRVPHSDIFAKMTEKTERLGGYDAHKLWHDTEF